MKAGQIFTTAKIEFYSYFICLHLDALYSGLHLCTCHSVTGGFIGTIGVLLFSLFLRPHVALTVYKYLRMYVCMYVVALGVSSSPPLPSTQKPDLYEPLSPPQFGGPPPSPMVTSSHFDGPRSHSHSEVAVFWPRKYICIRLPVCSLLWGHRHLAWGFGVRKRSWTGCPAERCAVVRCFKGGVVVVVVVGSAMQELPWGESLRRGGRINVRSSGTLLQTK